MVTSEGLIDGTSEVLLSFISSYLDAYGAKEWSLRAVAAASAVIFLGIRKQIGRKYDIDWDALIHAIIVGFGSAFCLYLDYNATAINGVHEPLGSITCNGPLTSLHRIIPAITQGYAICEIMNSFRLGPDALAHGVATFSVALIFNEFNASHILTPMLIMEISTIVLATLRAEFYTPTMQLITQVSFALLFFISRILISPVVYYNGFVTMIANKEEMGECFHDIIFYATIVFGFFFQSLNLFWFEKLIKKIKRKLAKQESMDNMSRYKKE